MGEKGGQGWRDRAHATAIKRNVERFRFPRGSKCPIDVVEEKKKKKDCLLTSACSKARDSITDMEIVQVVGR